MKVTQLILQNFGSFHGCHTVPMADQGLVFVRGENLDEPKSPSNGAGKSTIFDALDWCLFGEVPKDDVTKSIINDEAKKDCAVIATLEDKDGRYLVFRFRALAGKNGVKFFSAAYVSIAGSWSEWKNETALDESKTQETINDALGLDRKIFRAAIYRAQGEGFSFADATDGEKKEMLTALIPELQEIDDMRDRAKAAAQEVQTARALLQGGIQQAETELNGLKNTDWAMAEVAWQAAQSLKLQQAAENLHAAQGSRSGAEMQLGSLQDHKDKLAALLASPFVPYHAWSMEYDRLVHQRSLAQSQLSMLQGEYAARNGELLPFQQGQVKAGPCPCCKQQVSAEHIQHEIVRMKIALGPLIEQGKTARGIVDAFDVQIKEALKNRTQEQDANHRGASSHSQAVGQLKVQVQQLEGLQKQLAQLEGQVNSWKFHFNALQNEAWPGTAQKTQALHRMADIEQFIFHQQEQIAGLTKREKLVGFWIDALTAKGLKNLIMDSRIEEMTIAANAWVQALTGGTTWVRFETQTMTAKGTLSEKMNVRIFRHNPDGTITERNFKSWSGGEKTRVALGVDQGLSRLIADRATKPWEILILDEAFSRGLDGGGREAVFELIQKIHGGTVFVVDHTDLSGYFDKQLVVRCKSRRSEAFREGVSCRANHDLLSYLPQQSSA